MLILLCFTWFLSLWGVMYSLSELSMPYITVWFVYIFLHFITTNIDNNIDLHVAFG